ncbi:unnamed protein product [Linum tenue]|uniref:Uncharacterized protein n=1 Tax=Linum tenue TaxID=586396 RepID=A0AAV0N967_9ROSI|nr:unnamed protein product [Linum tenue]
MRGVQVPPPKVPAGLHLRALLSAGRAAEVRERAQDLRGQQREQAAQRGSPAPAGGRRQLAGVRGRGPAQGPRLRLRGGHLRAAAPGHPPPEGARRHQRPPHPLRLHY